MTARSGIEWLRSDTGEEGASWTPVRAARFIDRPKKDGSGETERVRVVGWHCEPVHSGCVGCYAEDMNQRWGTRLPYKPGHRKHVEIFLDEKMLHAPLDWREPRRIFPFAMTDLFGAWVRDEWIDQVFGVIRKCPQHTFIILTKRPDRMERYFLRLAALLSDPLPNVWAGASCSTQEDAEQFLPAVLNIPESILTTPIVSFEPLNGPIDATRVKAPGGWWDVLRGRRHIGPSVSQGWRKLGWGILGGGSGKSPISMELDWDTALLEQFLEAGVPVYNKQLGSRPLWRGFDGAGTLRRLYLSHRKGGDPTEWPPHLRVRQFPKG
jgi:protein gp37